MSDGAPVAPPNNEPSGAVTSREATAKKPSQGKFKSGISDKRSMNKPIIDTNKHGIRRETTVGPKKTRPKKV
jgi:hypothetical protein